MSLPLRSLTVLHTPDADVRGRVIPIGDGLTLGRVGEEDLGLAVNDKLLSRRHATIAPSSSLALYELIDHGSRNGSFVDGSRTKRRHLDIGSIIRLGVTLFELTCDEEAYVLLDRDAKGDDGYALHGRSQVLHELMKEVRVASQCADPVLLVGESGTGKEIIGKRIHDLSRQAAPELDPYVVVSCGPDPISGKPFERARGGTVYLDEIDLLGREHQAGLVKSLAALDNVRVIAATDANIEALVDSGRFDADLASCVGERQIEIPSLRSRRSDIPHLARLFLSNAAPKRHFDWSVTFLEKLLLYDWPLNARELRSVIQRLTLVDDEITTLRSALLPKEIRKRVRQLSEDQLRASAISVQMIPSRDELASLLTQYDGSVAGVAKHFAKDKKAVDRWLKRHDLRAADFCK